MLTHVKRIRARRALLVWYEISIWSPDARSGAVRAGCGGVGRRPDARKCAALNDFTAGQYPVGRDVDILTELEIDVKLKLA
jgi:hypothetical protein